MSKTLYFLIGPKGSGKTFIGTNVSQKSDIHFLRVEPIWLALREDEDGWQKVARAVHLAFTQHEKVMIENLGAGPGFNGFLSVLQSQYATKIIKVNTDLSLCYQRVKERSSQDHIPVSDETVLEYNEIASQVTLNWDLIVDNDGQQPIDHIIDKILNL